GYVYVDLAVNFGERSAPGIFGRVADTMVKIFRFHGIADLIKWVDDFGFFCYP
ncbi:hypothetical protein EV360DRAFT_27535, partial [Lentinula raphanica]